MTHLDKDVAVNRTVADLVDGYQSEHAKIVQAYQLLAEARTNLSALFSTSMYVMLTNEYCTDPNEAVKKVTMNLKHEIWTRLINQLGIRKVMSISENERVSKILADKEHLPDIEFIAIMDLLSAMVQNSNKYAQDAVKEVFDWLRPHDPKHKTNQKNATFEIGKKVIITNMVECCEFWTHANYSKDANLVALDKVFTMLDGKGVPEGYKSPLVDAIALSHNNGRQGETDYFKFKAYPNGNLHLEFKRLDLLRLFNAHAGGMNLKPSN